MLDDVDAPQWIHDLIKQLENSQRVDLSAIIIANFNKSADWSMRETILRSWIRLNKLAFQRLGDPLNKVAATYSVPTILAKPEPGTGRLRDETTGDILAKNLDLIVHLGSSAVPQSLARCARLGIWNFRYEGYNTPDTEVALFWMLLNGSRTCELVLAPQLAGHTKLGPLYRCTFRVHPLSLYLNLILDSVRRRQILMRCLRSFAEGRCYATNNTESSAPDSALAEPSPAAMVRYIPWWFGTSLRHMFRKVWFREKWFIGYSKTHITGVEDSDPHQFNVLWPPGRFNYADPFLFRVKDSSYLFFEKWQWGHKGSIFCVEIDSNGNASKPREVLARDYHLSYPFVFEWQGEFYLLPESSDNRTIDVYRAVEFPWRWQFASTLISNTTAVDPTIVEHNGKLWLFVSGFTPGPETNETELSIFYADSLFGEWTPHPKNPVVRDVRSARSAGRIFYHDGKLIRPGQDCSEYYGFAISLNRIDVLTETDYREHTVSTIRPDWIPDICATHNLDQKPGLIAIDAKVRTPVWRLLRNNREPKIPGPEKSAAVFARLSRYSA